MDRTAIEQALDTNRLWDRMLTGLSPADVDAVNHEIERQELTHWSTCPERFACYITRGSDGTLSATTWLGTLIGTITATSTYHNNLTGTRMRHVHIRGTNGAVYYGSFDEDWSQFCLLRRLKS